MPTIRIKNSDGTFQEASSIRVYRNGSWQEASDVRIVGSSADSTQERLKVISSNDHPNLYFNNAEIEEMQDMVLGGSGPQLMRDSYFDHVQGETPADKPSNLDDLKHPDSADAARGPTNQNMRACFDYMIEPTSSKASAIRDALMTWTETKPKNWNNGSWCYDALHADSCQHTLAFMYDLIYPTLDSSDITQFDDWFQWAADAMFATNSWWANRKIHSEIREGEGERQSYANWWIHKQAAAFSLAMVSHEKTYVDKIGNSEFPEDDSVHPDAFLIENIEQFDPATRGLKNLISGTIYPSGYCFDGYLRNYGFDAENITYDWPDTPPDHGQGQSYHHWIWYGLRFCMTAAAHNGWDAFSYKNEAYRRAMARSAPWQHSAFRNNSNGGTNYDHRADSWVAYRYHKDDSDLDKMYFDNPHGDYQSDHFESISRVMNYVGPIWGLTPVDGIDL